MTNEEYIKAIEMRTSRRTYKNKKMDADIVAVIKEMVDYVNESQGLDFHFIEDASSLSTVLTGSFAFIALCGDDTEKDRIKCGYFGETIVLQCTYHGLGTCWVTGTYNENKTLERLDLPQKTRLYGVIAVGLVKPNKSMKENVMYNALHKTSKPYQKMFEVCDRKLPPYYQYAMKMVEIAPSATNRRCVKFGYEEGLIFASVEEPYSDKSIDFGIAQLHFQLGAKAKGIDGEWNYKGQFMPTEKKVIKFPEQESEDNE